MNYLEWMLRQYKTEKLAEWFDIFNTWNYPDDFILIKPTDWDFLALWDNKDELSRTKFIVSKPYMNAIQNIIGRKETLRYHHIHNLKMKNYQFEIWWFVDKVINHFGLKYIDENFHFNVYGFMAWERYSQ